jgi:hypothetical protein
VCRERRVSGVTTHHLDTFGNLGLAASVDRANAMPPVDEKVDGSQTDRSGPENDVDVVLHG